MKNNGISEYFEEVEVIKEYDGYFCSVAEAITIVILGSICGLKNVSQIQQWATNERTIELSKRNCRNYHKAAGGLFTVRKRQSLESQKRY